MLATTQVQTKQLADRTAYDLYVPPTYDGSRVYDVLVSVLPVHPDIPRYRPLELFSDFADANEYLLVAPRFEMSSGFQLLGMGTSFRYDHCLLEIVEEVGGTYNTKAAQFDMFGYSAGGQFGHRFMYLHRDRLRAIAIGAPGTVTLPNTSENWPAGIGDVFAADGVDSEEISGYWPRILLFVGDQDISTEFLTQTAEANRFGLTRLQRAQTLHSALLEANIPHQYLEVPGMLHTAGEAMDRLMPRVWHFFRASSAAT